MAASSGTLTTRIAGSVSVSLAMLSIQPNNMCTAETPTLNMFGHSAAHIGTTKTLASKEKSKTKRDISNRSQSTEPRQHKLKSDTPACWTLLQQEQNSQQVKQQQQAYLQAAWLNIWTTGSEP